MSTHTATAAPLAGAEQAERVPWLRGVAWPLARRTAIALWRHLLTLYVLTRLGLVWAAFCAATGLADTHTRVDRDSGKTTTRVRHVPRLDRIDVGPTAPLCASSSDRDRTCGPTPRSPPRCATPPAAKPPPRWRSRTNPATCGCGCCAATRSTASSTSPARSALGCCPLG